jgi:hypothetical protein
VAETAIRVVPADGFVCHQGNSDDHWLVVLDGLVKVASVPLEGKSMSFVGVPTARWFGEGSLLKPSQGAMTELHCATAVSHSCRELRSRCCLIALRLQKFHSDSAQVSA